MQGIELSRRYYEEYGREMIHSSFPEYEGRIAAGIAGPGSDCFGFDDEVSTDHDSGAGFCLWLTDEDYEKTGFALSRAYAALPGEIDGVKKAAVSPYGKGHFGVMKIPDFFLPLTGCAGAPASDEQWLYTPDFALAAAVNGEIFRDDLKEFTKIREEIKNGMPCDVRLKKIAARVIGMAQSGQYNYARCLAHGEKGAAALAKAEFAKNCISLVYLLNNSYAPYYKWALRGMKTLPVFGEIADEIEDLLCSETNAAGAQVIENICSRFAAYFRQEGLSVCRDDFLEMHAYEIQNKIKSPKIRNLHIMEPPLQM
ncbi:MAG: DUF4037 domain-containing protein [Clostridia bacterium]|nr:DUF4037 domain-containing protein [Clostridia bacterium]